MWIKALVAACLAVLLPVQGIMGATLAVIIIDLVVGILSARKRGEQITSAGLRRTVSKLCIYEVGIIAGFLIQHYMVGDDVPCVKLITAAIGLVEGTSVLENLNELNGSPIFAKVLALIGSKNDETPK
jgi:hypothetical protein